MAVNGVCMCVIVTNNAENTDSENHTSIQPVRVEVAQFNDTRQLLSFTNQYLNTISA